MALPDMVVDKPVLDGSQNGAWSRGHVCVRVAGDIPGAVEECVLVALTDSVLLKIADNLRPQPRQPPPVREVCQGRHPSGLMAFDQPWRTPSERPSALDGLRSGC
jgi:hypothetical protein